MAAIVSPSVPSVSIPRLIFTGKASTESYELHVKYINETLRVEIEQALSAADAKMLEVKSKSPMSIYDSFMGVRAAAYEKAEVAFYGFLHDNLSLEAMITLKSQARVGDAISSSGCFKRIWAMWESKAHKSDLDYAAKVHEAYATNARFMGQSCELKVGVAMLEAARADANAIPLSSEAEMVAKLLGLVKMTADTRPVVMHFYEMKVADITHVTFDELVLALRQIDSGRLGVSIVAALPREQREPPRAGSRPCLRAQQTRCRTKPRASRR